MLSMFEICDEIPEQLKLIIRYIHVFDDKSGFNALFVTSHDVCFGVGANTFGALGLGHNKTVHSEEIVHQLNRQKCQRFINGLDFVVGLTDEHRVYAWGLNNQGQVGQAAKPVGNSYKKPKLVSGLWGLDIVDISCGFHHSLALTSGGDVYGWGGNSVGQVGVGLNRKKRVETATQLEFPNGVKIKAICGYNYSSFAVSTEGQVFSWGYNGNQHLGHFMRNNGICQTPQPIRNLVNIVRVCPSGNSTHFMNNEGEVWVCGLYGLPVPPDEPQVEGVVRERQWTIEWKPRRLPDVCVNDMDQQIYYQAMVSIPVAIRGNTVYAVMDDNQFQELKYKSFEYFYASEFQLTYKTIQLSDNRLNIVNDSDEDTDEEADGVQGVPEGTTKSEDSDNEER